MTDISLYPLSIINQRTFFLSTYAQCTRWHLVTSAFSCVHSTRGSWLAFPTLLNPQKKGGCSVCRYNWKGGATLGCGSLLKRIIRQGPIFVLSLNLQWLVFIKQMRVFHYKKKIRMGGLHLKCRDTNGFNDWKRVWWNLTD